MKRHHIPDVVVVYLIAGVRPDLEFSRATLNTSAGNRSDALKTTDLVGQTAGTVHVSAKVVSPCGLQVNDMHIYETAAFVSKNEVERPFVGDLAKAPVCHRPPEAGEVGISESNVEIVVGACLDTEKRIDAPSAIHPDGDPGLLKQVEYDENVGSAHFSTIGISKYSNSRPDSASRNPLR